jgi:ABC-type cobalamin/Fe3+-siderophores transport system ATPase subunit
MKIESLTLSNFRCFGLVPTTMNFADNVTTFIGGNGAGKTAALSGLARLFGISRKQRSIVKSDFHIARGSGSLADGAELYLEAILAFPELAAVAGVAAAPAPAVAEFWRQMAASADGAELKVRIRLKARWVDDGTPDGAIEEDIRWITRLDDDFVWDDCPKVSATDRASVQMIYVPAMRRAEDQVKALLASRLWRAAKWSDGLKTLVTQSAQTVQGALAQEPPVAFIRERLQNRWNQVHTADTDTDPVFRLIENRFEHLIRQTEIRFSPDEADEERELSRLSDGQKSLFHIALTAATLEVERDALALDAAAAPFDQSLLKQVPLTILAIEEPENSLSPFFLSRIMQLVTEIGAMPTAQVLLASHSASMLSRIEPEDIRYFRLDQATANASVKTLTLPEDDAAAKAYIRLAVRAYPELYFARFAVLGEGDSEQLVLPRLAAARGLPLDRSFVPIVPLGGRYVAHFWRLLNDLDIPHATLLDLDLGRQHGGANMVRATINSLAEVGKFMETTVAMDVLGTIQNAQFGTLADTDFQLTPGGPKLTGDEWVTALEEFDVFFSSPIDLDFAMSMAFPAAYHVARPGGHGPDTSNLAIPKRKKTVLKKNGNPALYPAHYDLHFVYYAYHFMQGSKPASHLSALTTLTDAQLAANCPPAIGRLLDHIESKLSGA